MSSGYILTKQSGPLQGEVSLSGAKNAVLAIMSSLLLTSGKSILKNVPAISDVYQMIGVLKSLGVSVDFDSQKNILEVDTSTLQHTEVDHECIKKFRASLLILGPLLARFKDVKLALPGGDEIGARPIDFHIKNFIKMGASVHQEEAFLYAHAQSLQNQKIVLDYPSVGATENLMMALTLVPGRSQIVNAALEPEVLDLITVLKKMGAQIEILPPATIQIDGVQKLYSVEHTVMPDRLEAGSLLIAGAITKGDVYLPDARLDHMDLFIMKLQEMGHKVTFGKANKGIRIQGSKSPRAVSFKTAPYPGFPTDLQPLMVTAQAIAHGACDVVETVFENRFLHVPELNKMGAKIEATGHSAKIVGVTELYGTNVVATDIRAACTLALAGFVAQGETIIENGYHHWNRGYETLDKKLRLLGANIELVADKVDKKQTIKAATVSKKDIEKEII